MSTQLSLFVQASPEKCSGCRACEVACFARRTFTGVAVEKSKTVGTVTMPVIPNLFVVRTPQASMPVQCHHCEDAPCQKACLPGALSRVDGSVRVDPRRCIACRNCALACPFGAIEVCGASSAEKIAAFYGEAALARGGNGGGDAPIKYVFKCDLCADRGDPACVDACPNKALRVVDTDSEVTAKRQNALTSAPQSEEFLSRLDGASKASSANPNGGSV